MFARYLYRHSRYISLFILCTVAVGITSFKSISRQEDPTLTNFVGTITVFFPGATPDRVEALVTRPLEDELRSISEIDEIQSTSSTGVSFIGIKLAWEVPDGEFERVWSEVRDAIDEAALAFPPGAGQPKFDNDRARSFTSIVAFSSASESELSLSILSRLAQEFADRARNLSGTKLVETFGEPLEEIRVSVDESALISRGLSLLQISRALQAADVKVSSGRATGAGIDMLVEIAGDLDSLERIRQVIVNTSPNGSVTRISDLAQVYRAAVTPPSTLALAQGKPAILVGGVMEPGGQVDTWSEAFRKLVEDFRRGGPAGLAMEISYEQSGYARDRLAQVGVNLALGVLLVLLVLMFTMGWRAAVVVAVVLPLCGLMSITVMERIGIELQQMSVSGLMVALGLLVDGSIVMTDEVRKRLLQGHAPLEAIGGAVDRLRAPLLSSALTTVLAFVPMAIAPGPPGDYLGSIAIAVIIMLASSTLLAIIITPVLAAWLLPQTPEQAAPWYSGGAESGALGRWLVTALDWSLHHPLGSVSLALALPLTGFLAFSTLTTQFFPGTDRDQLYVQVKLSDGRSIYDTRDLVERIERRLRVEPLIRRVDWTMGESPPAFFYNMLRTKDGIPTWAEALVLTRDEEQTDELIRRLQIEFDREFTEARVIVRGIDMGPPVTAPLEIEIYGPDLAMLRELGERFRLRLEKIPQVTHSSATAIGGAPKLVFLLNEEKLRLASLQLGDVADSLNDSLRGRLGGEVLEGTERMPVRVRLKEQNWGTSDRISNLRLPLNANAGQTQSSLSSVPLNAIGAPKLQPAQSPITRLDGERLNTVQGFLVRGILPAEALNELRQDLEQYPINLPDGYRYQFGGDSQERAKVVNSILSPIGLVIAGLLATILITFNSWRLSAIAGLVCVCSTGLSLFCLALFNYPFGVMALLGVIGSIGVSINAAIIIMTALQAHESARHANLVAVRTVVMDSSRHIVSTTVTTFGGFLPLILEGSSFWTPFAMAIAGGVLLSTIISFFLVPPLFVVAMRPRGRTHQGKTQVTSASGATPAELS